MKNAVKACINLADFDLFDEDGKDGCIESPVAVRYCNCGDVTKYLDLVGQ